jgi:hypothetical protein
MKEGFDKGKTGPLEFDSNLDQPPTKLKTQTSIFDQQASAGPSQGTVDKRSQLSGGS